MKLKSLLLHVSVLLCSVLVFSQTPFESLNFIYSIQGEFILSGQHNDQKRLEYSCGLNRTGPTDATYWTDELYDVVGKYPALYGGDFGFSRTDQERWDVTYESERQWNAGAVVNIMWHSCPPTSGATCQWEQDIKSQLNQAQWQDLLTEGGNLNTIWKSRVNDIAQYLQYLEDAGVEVLWRPYHEQNQTGFWWNSLGAENTKSLWRMMHDYMTNDLGLNNLIWVLDVQDLNGGSDDFSDWDPGDQYWDIIALDVYEGAYTNGVFYQNLKAVAGDKPIAIGECFELPNATVLNNFPDYTFFMNWAYGLRVDLHCNETNNDQEIIDAYNNPRVLTRDEMPGWGNVTIVPANLLTGKNVTVSSTEVGDNVKENVNDLNLNTRWSSQYTDDEWIAFELGGSHYVDSIRITWEAAYASDYEIQFSMDGNTWSTVEHNTNNTELYNSHDVGHLKTSHIRIVGNTRATEFGYSIFEVEAFGAVSSSPYYGTPFLIPTTIQAEDYDLGGEGVAYHDLVVANEFEEYRAEDVDIQMSLDVSGNYNIGGFNTGEWLNYSIVASSTAEYDIVLRVATLQTGTLARLEIDGQDVSGLVSIPNTGGWQVWEDVSINNVTMTEGEHTIQLISENDYFNVNYLDVAQSTVTEMKTLTATKHQLSAYPSPFSVDTKLDLSHIEGAVLSVKYFTINGVELGGLNSFSEETLIIGSGWESGVYLIQVVTTESTKTIRVIKE